MSKITFNDTYCTITSSIGLDVYVSHPITIQYFLDNFSHTIEFIKNLKVTIWFPDESSLISHTDWLDFFFDENEEYLNLNQYSKDSIEVVNDNDREDYTVSIPLIVYLIDLYEKRIEAKPLPLVLPFGAFADVSKKILRKAGTRLVTLSERKSYVQKMIYRVTEKIYYIDERDYDEIGYDFFVHKTLLGFLGDLSLGRRTAPEDLEPNTTILLSDNIKEYSRKITPSNIFLYIAFCFLFLDDRHFIFSTNNIVQEKEGLFMDRLFVDEKKLSEILKKGIDGYITNINIDDLEIKVKKNQFDEFIELKSKIRESYYSIKGDNNNELLEKAKNFIEEQINKFDKAEFYIGTKDKKIDFINTIVTQNDPKKFHETKIKLPGEYIGSEEKPLPKKGQQRIYRSKTKL